MTVSGPGGGAGPPPASPTPSSVPPPPAHASPDALDRLFGKRPDGLPVWLRPEALEAEAFDPEEYMGDVKRLVPLDTLASELHAYLATLKARLTDVLNADYDDFIALSSGLADVEGAVNAHLRPRLASVRAALDGAAAAVAARQAALRTALAKRDDARAARRGLELVRDAAAAAGRAEALLAEAATPATSSLADRARALERAAAAVTALGDLAARGAGVPLVDALAPRAVAAREGLGAALRDALAAALSGDAADAPTPASTEAALHVLQAWASLGEPRAAEAAVREVGLEPVIQAALEAAAAGRAAGGGDTPTASTATTLAPPLAADAVPTALAAVLDALRASPVGALLRAASSDPGAGLGGLRLLPMAAAAAGDALAAAAPGAFSPGVPSTFVAAYAAADAFIDGLDASFGGGGGASGAGPRARGSPEAAAWLARWPLPAYAALRFAELAGGVEAALTDADASAEGVVLQAVDGAAGVRVHTRPAAAVAAALARTADPAGFLPALTDRCVRAALQVAARYAAWLHAGADVRREAADKAGRGGAEEGGGGGGSGPAPPPAAAAAPQPSATPPPSGPWAATAPVDDTLLAAADAAALANHMRTALPAALGKALGSEGARAPVLSAATTALSKGAARLDAAADALLAAAGAAAAAAAAPHLAQLRGVAATFRVTARPPPTRAAPYAAACLGPVAAVLGVGASPAPGAAALSPSARTALASAAVSGIASRFEALAADLLGALRRAEASLARLKAARPGGAAAAADGPSDADKVAAQVFLDVVAFGRAAAGLPGVVGLAVADLPAFRSLWDVAAPEGRVGAVDLGEGGGVEGVAAPPAVPAAADTAAAVSLPAGVEEG